MRPNALSGGFAAPAHDAAFAFRAIMTAMARPGRITEITGAEGPTPLSTAAATVLLTLCDSTTKLYLAGDHDTKDIRAWIGFHTGAPLCDAAEADFALGGWAALTPLSAYPAGSPAYPDRSTTLIVEMPRLAASGATLRGPGIRDSTQLSLPDTTAFQENARRFPLGLDFIFTSGHLLAALPRSTEVC